MVFIDFYLPRFGIAVGVSSLLHITRKKWWIIVLSILLSIGYVCLPTQNNVALLLLMCAMPLMTFLCYVCFNNNEYLLFKNNVTDWIIGLVFFLSIIAQCIIFQYLIYNTIYCSLPSICFKLSIAAFLSCFSFLTKRKYWIILVSFLIEIWLIAELMYYRANGFFLDGCAMTMVGNMDGFWGSLWMLIRPLDVLSLLPLIGVIICVCLCRVNTSNHYCFYLLFAISMIVNVLGCVLLQKYKYVNVMSANVSPGDRVVEWNPWGADAMVFFGIDKPIYIQELSFVHAFVYDVKELLTLTSNSTVKFSLEDKKVIRSLVQPTINAVTPQSPLIICLIESLETWAIRPDIMPNLCRFIDTHNQILHAKRLISQVGAGASSDGQLITNTGLLPIKKGAVCFRYCSNVFPSLSSLYEHSCGQIPHDLGVWNQAQMSKAYGLDTNYVVSSSDKVIFSHLATLADTYDYVLAFTCSTHTPFNAICDSSQLDLDEQMPYFMRKYIRSFNYMDEGLSLFLNAIDNNPSLRSATIAITGDHIIFQQDLRTEFAHYDSIYDMHYNVSDGYIPLIVYSPLINHKTIIEDVAYQMDIYPTILHLIGCEDYYWKGLGRNLLMPANAPSYGQQAISREHSVDVLKDLSDKLIRSNYFATIKAN
ncbi:MAG: sulfatase-like hydrolase/transferase [Prevotellaceae bacterium]|nr:sulfatase-like hydrolase/transferase [Candidatus Faecinaster equi]